MGHDLCMIMIYEQSGDATLDHDAVLPVILVVLRLECNLDY